MLRDLLCSLERVDIAIVFVPDGYTSTTTSEAVMWNVENAFFPRALLLNASSRDEDNVVSEAIGIFSRRGETSQKTNTAACCQETSSKEFAVFAVCQFDTEIEVAIAFVGDVREWRSHANTSWGNVFHFSATYFDDLTGRQSRCKSVPNIGHSL
jgi:hypothetical protein